MRKKWEVMHVSVRLKMCESATQIAMELLDYNVFINYLHNTFTNYLQSVNSC